MDNQPTPFDTDFSNFQARYGYKIPDNNYLTNEFVENIITRKTTRRFIDKKIDDKLLEKLFAAAQSAPTGCMFQPWSAIVIKSKKNKLDIFFNEKTRTQMGFPYQLPNSEKTTKSDFTNYIAIVESDIFVIWCVDLNMIETILDNVSPDNINGDITPDEILLAKESFDYSINEIPAIWDAVIAAQTFCLAAESMGLGTMYCGSIKNIDLAEPLNLPSKVMPLFGICLGYPHESIDTIKNQNSYIKPRLPQNLIVHTEKYVKQPFDEFVKYNDLMSKFYQLCDSTGDWFTRIIKRSQITKNSRLYKKLINKYKFWLH